MLSRTELEHESLLPLKCKGKIECKSEAGERWVIGYVAKLAEMMVVEHDVDVDQIRVVVSFDLLLTTTSRQISLVVHNHLQCSSCRLPRFFYP